MADPVRFRVVCDHPEQNRRYLVADITDHRPDGGIDVELFRGGVGTRLVPTNKRGSRRRIPMRCGACELNVELEETSLPELLDRLGPHREQFPASSEPVEQLPDLGDGWYEVMVDGADPGPSQVVGHVEWHIVSLRELSAVVGALRTRSRR